ncbi:MAG: agmatine deiminase family protein [Actinomycetota bacterium]
MKLVAETARHERTLMAWPTQQRQAALWHDVLESARADTAGIARAIADYEPVTMVVHPDDFDDATLRCGPTVDIVTMVIDDSWMRDSGPIVVLDHRGERQALHFQFNAWGKKFARYAADATLGTRIAQHLGLPVIEVPFVLEGGAIAYDGAGTIVTTERCLLNPNRNPGRTRTQVEDVLATWLGAPRVVWLADAIAEDAGTDGHVDNAVAFVAPDVAVLQGCDDATNPNFGIARDNRNRLEAAGIEVLELAVLPYATIAGARVPVPYLNYYVANGAVVVPVTGHRADAAVLGALAEVYTGREVIGVPGGALAYGGGGVHCITQSVPLVRES